MEIDPAKLLAEARQEPVKPKLADFAEAMEELRTKGFTFRQIAEWLRLRGIEVDHNGVYRVLVASTASTKSKRPKREASSSKSAPIPGPVSPETDDENSIPL
jgi:hypothetical protein